MTEPLWYLRQDGSKEEYEIVVVGVGAIARVKSAKDAFRIIACVNALKDIPYETVARGPKAIHEFFAWRKMEDETK